MTQKKQVLCDLQVLFLLFNCQTPEEVDARIYETRFAGQIKITGTHLEEDVISMLKSSYEND